MTRDFEIDLERSDEAILRLTLCSNKNTIKVQHPKLSDAFVSATIRNSIILNLNLENVVQGMLKTL